MLPGDGPVHPKECWEITPCDQCPDKMTPACPKFEWPVNCDECELEKCYTECPHNKVSG
jgi:hypothetical protein